MRVLATDWRDRFHVLKRQIDAVTAGVTKGDDPERAALDKATSEDLHSMREIIHYCTEESGKLRAQLLDLVK